LFRPRTNPSDRSDSSDATTPKADSIEEGKFDVEKLVDLSRHNYRLEPNLRFTPDGKWIVFRSNMHGPTHVYAVEVAKAK
jgi:oligogalacturonide lyase